MAISLVVTGALMLAALFLRANPSFGSEAAWPWTQVMDGHWSILESAVYILWTLTGLWALVFGLTRLRRTRAVMLLVLGSALLIAAYTLKGATFGELLALVLLGGGLLIARRPNSRGLGRLLAAVGAVLFVWFLAKPYSGGNVSALEAWWGDAQALLKDWGTDFGQPDHAWKSIASKLLLLLGAAFGILTLFGLTHRVVLLVAFYVLLAGLLMPVGVEVVNALSNGWDTAALASQLSADYVGYVLLWVLGAFLALDLSYVKECAA